MKIVQSASFKLTLAYLGIIMVLSLLFSVVIYNLSYRQMAANANRQIENVERLLLPPELQQNRIDYEQQLTNQLAADQTSLLYRLAALNLATLLVGGGAAYLLALTTLKPIEEAMEAQGRFTADASHELRTPLTAMRSEIEVALREKQLSIKDARALLGSNLEEIAKLEALSGGLLRLARFENKLDSGAVENVAVTELFEDAVDRNQSRLNERHIELEVTSGPETVAGDRASLVELVSILLDNAIKYSPERSQIKLASKTGGHFVYLSVADQGIGIKSSDLPFIFHRFYRADRARSQDEVSGYGLGLSIAKRVADLHRGEITVESTPSKGSTFQVKLPVKYDTKSSFIQL
jgi:two-component system, OmpR family, sensor histidine kinase CiaH